MIINRRLLLDELNLANHEEIKISRLTRLLKVLATLFAQQQDVDKAKFQRKATHLYEDITGKPISEATDQEMQSILGNIT